MRVILNPTAGGGEGGSGEWRRALAEIGGAEVVEADGPGDAEKAAAWASEEGVDVVVAAGGDGTLHEVVNGLGTDPAGPVLGVLPLGTANDFARSIGVPEDPEEAVRLLREGEVVRVDLVRVEGPAAEDAAAGCRSRLMLNVAVAGVAGEVGERVDSETKRRWGALAYLRTAAGELPDLTPHSLRAELDGETVVTDVHHVIVANGRRTGGNLPVAPEALLDDGAVDVVLIPALNVPEMLSLIPELLAGRHLEGKRVRWRRVVEARFEAEPPLSFSLDGEPFARGTISFRVLPGVLRVLCGPGEERALGPTTPGSGETGDGDRAAS